MPSLELKTILFKATLSADALTLIQTNLDPGVKRLKSVHVDLCVSPNATASLPVIVDMSLHRHHNSVALADLDDDEGTRLKFERMSVGRTTDRYFRMWLKAINLENGYNLSVIVRPADATGGDPTYGLGIRYWEMISND